MDHGRRRKAEELFQEAADLPHERRSSFLKERCTTDSALRTEVESLLAGLEEGRIASLSAVEQISEGDADLVGTCIGPYKLLEMIGEGGLGAVYLAQQAEPVRRKVAVKIIKLGMDTKQVIARFEAERQALAMMDHPNVAKVFDAGATGAGRPYFAMELVRGNPITEYCDGNRLPVRQRLELFTQVCRAVQHAHQKGVIHRDIKPSNVMVTMHDGVPVAKIIDFGIAKATHEPLTEKTLFTRYHQFIGTPEYMSPEQAEMSGLDVDTRSDIYSLGVLLYELLTGDTPFDRKTLETASVGEIQRLICEQDAATPSRRVSAPGADSSTVARTHRADVRALSRLMRGDLDWIVMKALEKDRSRRYETAAALAEDVHRHLQSEPVSAGPPTRIYQFRKLVRRHKAAFSSIAAFFVLVTGVGIWMGLLYAEANRLRLQAEANLARAQDAEQRAKSEAQTAADIAEFLVGLFELADPIEPGWDPTIAQGLLDRGAERVRRDLKHQPETQATMLATIGEIYANRGISESAEPLLKEALQIRRDRLGAEHPDTISVMNILATAYMNDGRRSAAERLAREAMETARRALGDGHPETLASIRLLAPLLAFQGRSLEAEPLCREALATSRRTLGNEHPDTLQSMRFLSSLLEGQGRLLEAEELAREALQTTLRVLGETDVRSTEFLVLLGGILRKRGMLSEAEPLLRRAYRITRDVMGEAHFATAQCAVALAELFRRQGKLDEAEALYRQTWARSREALGDEHVRTFTCMCLLGGILSEQGKLAEAEQLLNKSLAGMRRLLGDGQSLTIGCLIRLTDTLLANNKGREAETLLRDYIATARESLSNDSWQVAIARSLLGTCHTARGDFEGAERLLLESHPAISDNLGERQGLTRQAIRRIVKLYEAWEKPDQASAWRAKLTLEPGQ